MLQGPSTDPNTVAAIRKAIREGRQCSAEILSYRKDGSEFWNRLSITPAINEAGRITYFIGSLRRRARRVAS